MKSKIQNPTALRAQDSYFGNALSDKCPPLQQTNTNTHAKTFKQIKINPPHPPIQSFYPPSGTQQDNLHSQKQKQITSD